jgi:hypothetical protein
VTIRNEHRELSGPGEHIGRGADVAGEFHLGPAAMGVVFSCFLTGLIFAKIHSCTLSFVLAGELLLVGTAICWFTVRKPLQPADKGPPAVADT